MAQKELHVLLVAVLAEDFEEFLNLIEAIFDICVEEVAFRGDHTPQVVDKGKRIFCDGRFRVRLHIFLNSAFRNRKQNREQTV